MSDFDRLLNRALKERISRSGIDVDSFEGRVRLEQDRDLLIKLLLAALDEVPTTSAADPSPPKGVKIEPTTEIIERAERLQRLAMGTDNPHERDIAWTEFEKLWQKYNLPVNLGMR